MHLLHHVHRSSSMFSGGDGGMPALRRVGSSPRAPPPSSLTRHTLSRSESIKKKKSGGVAKRSKRARLRAGLAAALQELRLSAVRKHGARGGSGAGASSSADVVASAGAARPPRAGGGDDDVRGAAATLHVSDGGGAEARQAGIRGVGLGAVAAGDRRVKNATAGGWPLLVVVAVLALACVVTLGRAPAVCCCTCAAWLCRSRRPRHLCGSASASGRHRSGEPPCSLQRSAER